MFNISNNNKKKILLKLQHLQNGEVSSSHIRLFSYTKIKSLSKTIISWWREWILLIPWLMSQISSSKIRLLANILTQRESLLVIRLETNMPSNVTFMRWESWMPKPPSSLGEVTTDQFIRLKSLLSLQDDQRKFLTILSMCAICGLWELNLYNLNIKLHKWHFKKNKKLNKYLKDKTEIK